MERVSTTAEVLDAGREGIRALKGHTFNIITLEETFDIDTLYVQNPPKRARASIEAFHDPSQIEVINYPYPALSKKRFRAFLRTWKNRYLGRKNAKNQYCQPCTGYRF